jgi:hypothetical protein
MKKILAAIILLITFQFSMAAPQDSVADLSCGIRRFQWLQSTTLATVETKLSFEPLKNQIDYNRLMWVGGAYVGAGVGLHIYQANAWWANQNAKFHIVNDWNYALWIDKVGHFYGTNILGHAISGGLEACNVQSEQSAIYSGLGALAFELLVEFEDGFGPDWGFSPGDATADAIGAAFYIGQYYSPFLKDIHPRWSYYPSKEMREGKHKGGIIIDDYEGQKYWLAFRIKNYLPKGVAEYWPSFLMVSAGMGVKDLDGSGGGTREFYIALDLDAEELPLHGPVWQFVKNSLNYFHFPMPGIKVSPDAAFFVFCF